VYLEGKSEEGQDANEPKTPNRGKNDSKKCDQKTLISLIKATLEPFFLMAND